MPDYNIDWNQYVPGETAVTCYTVRGSEVLLIHKKRGLGAGKVNGPGGRIENGETAEQAVVREVREEVGLTVSDIECRALLHFAFTDGYNLDVYAYVANGHAGELVETDEADPFWCQQTRIPYEKMWADDTTWLPLVLSGYSVEGWFVFEDDAMLWSKVESERSSDAARAS